jgi:hypothetical protein
VSELRGRLQTAHAIAREYLLQSKSKSKVDYKKAVHIAPQVGDKVLFDESVQRGRSRKVSVQWVGSYIVLAADSVNATIKKGRGTIKVHINRLKPFFRGRLSIRRLPLKSVM